MPWEDIVVNQKILGHISEGVYRSTGGALKELVSNAFDADAKRVVITTNHPSFDVISCYDNGIGMEESKFVQMMKDGIGNSSKRVETKYTRSGRPVIGRLGIGMLGIAQVCHEFQVISHHEESKTAFKATVKLMDFLGEKAEKINPKENVALDVGKFTHDSIEYDPKRKGTQIIASDMRSAFVRKFRRNQGEPLPLKYSAFLASIHSSRTIKELGDYWQMVWELATSCPIPYQQEGLFDFNNVVSHEDVKDITEEIQNNLESFDFELVIDGLSLRKPISFPYPKEKRKGQSMSGQAFSISDDTKVYGRELKYKGYLYLQDGQAIEPRELRGLLIRIKNVAVGLYDSAFLQYPHIEGPRFNWISGEIYVEEGLEQALNIDRDNFNDVNPHYETLQFSIHKQLKELFSAASKGVGLRSQVKQEEKANQKLDTLKQILAQKLKHDYEIIESEEYEEPVFIDTETKQVFVNSQSDLLPKTKSKKDLVQNVGIILEMSMLAPEEKQREWFYETLIQMLAA